MSIAGNEIYNHQPFNVIFYRKPIDEFAPWVGGYRHYCDLAFNRRTFGSKGKERELDVSYLVPRLQKHRHFNRTRFSNLLSFGKTMTEFFLRDFNPVYRIFSVQGSEGGDGA